MRRTQVYLDDDLWKYLQVQAEVKDTTVSDVVSSTLREKYDQDRERRKEAFEAVIGLWADRTDLPDTEEYIRKLRNTGRERIGPPMNTD